MSVSAELTTLIAFGSLIVSILSLIYVRRVHRFEVAKYTVEQLSTDIIIEVQKTILAEFKNNYVLLSNFRIINGTPSTVFIRYFSVWLNFKNNNKFFPRYMRLCLDPNGGRCGGTGYSMEILNLISSLGGIETAVVDKISGQRISFDLKNMNAIKPAPSSYAWKALTVVPKKLMDELYVRYFQLIKLDLIAVLHPDLQKSGSSSRFPSVLPSYHDEFDLDELSNLFPRYSFEYV